MLDDFNREPIALISPPSLTCGRAHMRRLLIGMRTIFLAFAMAFGLSAGSAQAQNWQGFYAGIHTGYGWGEAKGALGYDDPAFPGVTAADIFDPVNRKADIDGWLGG